MSDARHLVIKEAAFAGTSVVYVMSRDQRVRDNHALVTAQAFAKKMNVPFYVLFVIKKVPTRSREHYAFMLDGLREVSATLNDYGVPFIIRTGPADQQIRDFIREVGAGALFFDFNPLIGSRNLLKSVADDFKGSVTVVDTHNVIPAWVVSDKKEFAAHTMRTKVYRNLERFLIAPPLLEKQKMPDVIPASKSFVEAESYIEIIPASGIHVGFTTGEQAALARLKTFISDDLEYYAVSRNDIAKDNQSGLSPYLHFGQISSLRIILDVIDSVKEIPLLLQQPKLAEHGDAPSCIDGMNALLEEMIVRKELADNFCLYTDEYKSLKSAPEWAQKSLTAHAIDSRDFIYKLSEWEAAATHDEIWNAAQSELTKSGKIHGYMRMFWAKKILEWSASPDEAVQTAIYLNDKYSIDGGDPNGYVGILWSIAGLHDRPWFERPVYGTVRYMNAAGLRRKFDVDAYIERVKTL